MMSTMLPGRPPEDPIAGGRFAAFFAGQWHGMETICYLLEGHPILRSSLFPGSGEADPRWQIDSSGH